MKHWPLSFHMLCSTFEFFILCDKSNKNHKDKYERESRQWFGFDFISLRRYM